MRRASGVHPATGAATRVRSAADAGMAGLYDGRERQLPVAYGEGPAPCGATDRTVRRGSDGAPALTTVQGTDPDAAGSPREAAGSGPTAAEQRGSPCSGGGRSADQRPNTSIGRVTYCGTPMAAVPRARKTCRYCAAHGVRLTASSTHRASCQYYTRCPCFACRKLHLRNHEYRDAKCRRTAVAAARTVAARL